MKEQSPWSASGNPDPNHSAISFTAARVMDTASARGVE